MGERDACIRCGRKCGGDARHDLVRNLIDFQFVNFFASATKDKGISPFKAYDLFTLFRILDEDFFDLILREGVATRAFTHIDCFGTVLDPLEELRVG